MKLLRTIIELSNVTLGRLKSGRMKNAPKDLASVQLNLGCGLAVTKGWLNIDGSINALIASMPGFMHVWMYHLSGAKQYYKKEEYCSLLNDHIFMHHDLSYGIPFRDNIAHYIYSSHFFEHLYRKDAFSLLRECFRVLKLGGILRIAVPDLEFAVSLYLKGKKQEMLQNYFFVEDDDSKYARHKYMYDFELLEELLKEVGFKDIRNCKFQIGAVPDISILDNRPEESLFVEATK